MNKSSLSLIVLLAAAVVTSPAAEGQNPAFAPVKDDPKLPRVLLLGDSISIGYTVPVREALSGEANVHRAPTNCGPTTRGLEQLDAWLGEGKWDVIHFNWGLHDLKYVDDAGKAVSPERGHQQVAIADYEKNLRKLVERLQATGAKLIWCSTTPVPEGTGIRVAGDSVKYNAVAAKVMKEADVPTNDLYTFAKERQAEVQIPRNVHFTPKGSTVLGKEVARQIRAALQPASDQ